MDSDQPDLARVAELRDRYDAHLLVDVAHDLGVLGKTGRGALEDGDLLSTPDLIVGSFSKVFASIGGFVAVRDVSLLRAIQGFSGSYTFSNYLIPPQIGAVSAAFDIAFSSEGQDRRRRVLSNVEMLRRLLAERGVATVGQPSAMAIALVGDEAHAREAYRTLLSSGVILNCIEFPAVRRGEARFRMQLTPNHEPESLTTVADAVASAVNLRPR
jgi:glycine C-acetyltransferase